MATEYTPHTSGATKTLTAAQLNPKLQEIDDAIEDMGDGTDALASPSIVSFENATHDHSNAANGGLIEGEHLAFTGAASDSVVEADGSDNVVMGTAPILPTSYRQGLRISKLSDTEILVGIGSVMLGDVMVNKETGTVLDIETSADWVRGHATPYPDALVHVYVNEDGDLKLSDLCPNRSAPSTGNLICEARVNEPTWTVLEGQDATTVDYDDGGGGNPAGDANIQPGMLVGVYSDTGHTLGRGKGNLEYWADKNYMSFAWITAVDTDNKQLTLKAGHGIDIIDNDVLAVIPDGMVLYRYDDAWWRWLGGVYYTSAALQEQYADQTNTVFDESSDFTTTSTSLVPLVNMGGEEARHILTQGGNITFHIHGVASNNSTGGYAWIGASRDGLDVIDGSVDGFFIHPNPDAGSANRPQNFAFERIFTDVPPGTHQISVEMNTNNASYATTFHVADEHPQMWCKEVVEGHPY